MTTTAQRVFPNKEVGGGLGTHIKYGGKIWGKVRPSSPNKRQNLGSSVTTTRKSWGKVPILGSYLQFRGQIWGVCHLYFWRQNMGSNKNFRGKFWGQAHPPPPLPPTSQYESTPWGLQLALGCDELNICSILYVILCVP